MHRGRVGKVVGAVSFATAAVLAACVGSDPDPVIGASADGGSPATIDGSTSGADGSASNDGGSSSGNIDEDTGVTPPPPLDVRTLPGLRLWLESTKGVVEESGGIVSWTDASERWDAGAPGSPDGGAHVAVPIPNTGAGPESPGLAKNGKAGGRPAVTFTPGTQLKIANHEDFAFDKGDFVIAAVGAVNAGDALFWSLMTTTSEARGTLLADKHACRGQNPFVCTTPDADPSKAFAHLFLMRRRADQLLFRIDGKPQGTYDFNATSPSLTIADFQNPNAVIGSAAFSGEMSELLVIVGPTTDEDSGKLETHLKAKYKLP